MPDSIPIIDSSAVENLRALGDNDGGAFLREILGIYFADMPARLRELRERLAEGDQSGFTRAAHTIKGSSANVGAARVRAMAEEIEVRSRLRQSRSWPARWSGWPICSTRPDAS